MTLALTLTIATLTALLVRQHRKTAAAVKKSDLRYWYAIDVEHERDDAHVEKAALKVDLAATRAAARKSSAMALAHAVAAEYAEQTCLPRAPFRTADPGIEAVPWTGEAVVLTLPPLFDHTAVGKVTPIKRAAVKKAAKR